MLERLDSGARLPADDALRILESSPDPYLVLTADLRIVAVSDAYLGATNTQREKLLGRGIFDAFPNNPDDPMAEGVRHLRASLEGVLLHRRPDTMPLLRYDVRSAPERGGDFEVRFWSPRNVPVLDEGGNVRFIIHRAADVTASVMLALSGSEAALSEAAISSLDIDRFNQALGSQTDTKKALLSFAVRQSDQNALRVLETLPVIMWRADSTGAIDWFNDLWYTFTGQARSAALGWGWQTVVHPDDLSELVRMWSHAVEHATPFEAEYRLRGADGAFRWFLARAEPTVGFARDVSHWFGTCVDIDMQRRALERSERVAATMQQVFLPTAFPHRPNLRIDATYGAADHEALIGGDWYDAVELPDGRLMFSIGDVTGHGLDASVSAGRIRQTVYAVAFDQTDPALVLRAVNRTLFVKGHETMATAIVGFVDAVGTAVTYATAGHPPPIFADRAGGRSGPHGGGLPLGVMPEWESQPVTVPVAPDDVIALYTDGLTEFARDAAAGEQRLTHAVAAMVDNRTIARPAEAICDAVLGGASNRDDIALLILQFSAVDLATVERDNPRLRKTWRFNSCDAHTASSSRRELIGYLKSFAAGHPQLFAAELILGEILANTVEHAPGLVTVEFDWTGAKPVVTVFDTGPGLLRLDAQLPSDPYDEDGRGMFLIRSLAESFEVTPASGFGTELRITLPIERAMSRDVPSVR